MDTDRHCRLERDYIHIEIAGELDAREVAFAHCDTHEKILAWAEYFLANTKIPPDVLSRFIKLACDKHNFSLRMP